MNKIYVINIFQVNAPISGFNDERIKVFCKQFDSAPMEDKVKHILEIRDSISTVDFENNKIEKDRDMG